ncbi:MAG: hypothetical protein AABW68_05510, partial [archaeon]
RREGDSASSRGMEGGMKGILPLFLSFPFRPLFSIAGWVRTSTYNRFDSASYCSTGTATADS